MTITVLYPLMFHDEMQKKMIGAYILVVVRTGSLPDAMEKISRIDGIINTAIVSGMYDIIARADTQGMEKILRITDEIHMTGCVEKTLTHIISREGKDSGRAEERKTLRT